MIKIKFILVLKLVSAFKGYFFWHKLTHKYRLNECAVILIPTKNKEYTFYTVKYLKEMLANNHLKKALILSCDETVLPLLSQFKCNNYVLGTIMLSNRNVRDLLNFYNANMYDTRFIVASLEIPSGRNALDYLNLERINKEDLFAISVYNIITKLDLGVDNKYEKN